MALLSQSKFRRKLKLIVSVVFSLWLLRVFLIMQLNDTGVLEKGISRNKHQPIQSQQSVSSCAEKRNFVFIKVLKCAGTTLSGIFRRFAYTRDLTLVLPVRKNLYLNYPYPGLTRNYFRPSSRGYNILVDHSIFSEDDMDKLMPDDTVFISSIRHPFAQLKSSYAFFSLFGLNKFTGIPDDLDNPVYEYLSDLQRYETAYQANKASINKCFPDGLSLHKNIMSHFFAMPLGFPKGANDISQDNTAIQIYIEYIDRKFSLIMITEHFYESLIMLKRIMCWTFSDVIFNNQNVIDYKLKNVPYVPENLLNTHKRWSNADYQLYTHFNDTLWRRIRQEGPGFFHELTAFRAVQTQVDNYCAALKQMVNPSALPQYLNQTTVPASRWSKQFIVTPKDCEYLSNPYPLLFKMQDESDLRDPELINKQEMELRELERREAGRPQNCSKAVP